MQAWCRPRPWFQQASRICRKSTCRRSSSKSVAEVLQLDRQQQLTVNAWIRTVRKQRRLAFAELDDGSSLNPLQTVINPEQAEHLSTGTAVRVDGELVPSPSGKEQAWELRASNVESLGDNNASENPVQKKYQTPEFLRSVPHLRARTPHNALLLRLRSEVIAAATSYFGEEGFVQTHTPIITSSDCEGAGEVFTVTPRESSDDPNPFFREQKYLTVSSQLHLEALAQSVGKVWTLSPTFRAERSDTARHLSEFYMLEAELAFTRTLDDVMDVVEGLIRSITRKVQSSRVGSELLSGAIRHDERHIVAQDLQKRFNELQGRPWPRITYHEALDVLHTASTQRKIQFKIAPQAGEGLQTEHERYLAEAVGQGQPVFVTNYPKIMKPFYMATSKATGTVDCFDLLVPEICEIVGGSLREHSLETLQSNMGEKGLKGSAAEALEWYQDLRRYGSVPHGGFGLGFDRLLCYLGGIGNIRDVVAFPRWHGRCAC